MSISITRKSMAHALSIVGEAGTKGFEYDSAVNALLKSRYVSNKARWTLASSPEFDWERFRIHMAHAVREGLVDAGKFNERVSRGELSEEPWPLFLTLKGYAHAEDFDRPLLHRWYFNIWDNLPTFFLSILGAFITAWLVG